jgi:PAS domain S-box-containing protein
MKVVPRPSNTSQPPRKNLRAFRVFRYGLALLCVALAIFLTALVFPAEGRRTLVIVMAAVIVSALYGGLGPGLMAAVLGSLGSAFFLLTPSLSLRVSLAEDILHLVIFSVIAVVISYLVTLRKRAEEKLLEASQTMNLISEATHLVTWEWEVAKDQITTSESFASVYGLPRLATSAEGFALVLSEDKDEHLEKVQRVAKEGGSYFSQFRIKRADTGEIVWLEERGNALLDETGKVERLVGVTLDMTERKKVEEQLKLANYRFQVAEEAANGFLYDYDPRTGAESRSDGFSKVLGYRDADVPGGGAMWETLIHPEDVERVRSETDLAVRSGAPGASYEYRLRHKNGSWLWVLDNNTIIRDSEGQPQHIIGSIVDISERKRSENQLSLLAKASTFLASSLDLEVTLHEAAATLVPQFADWCVIDLLQDDGTIAAATFAHADPEKIRWAKELRERYPVDPSSPSGTPQVIRTGQSEFYPEISDALLQAVAKNDEELALLRSVGYSSAMVVPLQIRGRTMGAVTLVMTESGRHFTPQDVRVAEELARRCATAVDNARLFAGEHEARTLAEATTKRIASLQRVTAKLAGALTPKDIIEIIFHDGLTSLGAAGGVFALLNEAGDEFTVVDAFNYAKPSLASWRRFPVQAGLPMADVILSRQPLFFETREAVMGAYPDMAASDQSEHEAWIILPLEGSRKILGAVSISFAKARTFAPEERDFIQTLLGQCAQAFERAELYEKVRESEGQLRLVTDAMPALVSYIDKDLRYRLVNRAYTEWFGYKGEAILGKTMPEVLGEAAFARLRPHVETVLAGKTETFESEVPYKLGGTRFIHAIYTPDLSGNMVKGFFVHVIDLSERKRQEEARAWLAAMVGASQDAIFSFDLGRKVLTWNPAAEKMFGYSALEMVGNSVDLLVPEDRIGEPRSLMERLKCGEEVTQFETVRVRKNGERFHALLTLSPVRSNGGEILGVAEIIQDISERKGGEERTVRLQQLTSRLSAALSPDEVAQVVLSEGLAALGGVAGSVLVLEADGETLRLLGTVGYEAEVTEPWQRFSVGVSAPVSDAVRRHEGVWLATPEERLEHYPHLAETRPHHQAWAALPLLYQGKVVGALGLSYAQPQTFETSSRLFAHTLADLCAQALERGRLYQENFLVAKVPAENPNPVLRITPAGQILYANAAATPLLEFWRRQMQQPIPSEFQALLKHVFETGTKKTIDLDYHDRTLSCTLAPIPEGGYVNVYGNDITERKRAEEALREANEQLRVLSDRQKRFVADAAHELRAPLTAIQGNLQLMTHYKNVDPEMQQEMLSDVRLESERLARLVNDLLAIARGDSGLKLEKTSLFLNEVLLESWRSATLLTSHHEMHLGHLDTVEIMGNRDRLKQLVLILLENAIKYTPPGGRITMGLEHDSENLRLCVRDTGIGIDEGDLPHVFERFYRADKARTRAADPTGTGLGLSIAEWIVAQHDGKIWLESEAGKGTTAWVELPLAS